MEQWPLSARWHASLRFLWVAGIIVLLDQLSKSAVRAQLARGESWPAEGPIGGVFAFTHVHNTGMAFGLAQGRSGLFLALAIAVVLLLLVWQWQLGPGERWLRLALALQVGGAVGNAVDRVRLGHVTDFLDFQVWPVFNVADSSISIGVALLAVLLWRQEQAEAKPAEEDPAGGDQLHGGRSAGASSDPDWTMATDGESAAGMPHVEEAGGERDAGDATTGEPAA